MTKDGDDSGRGLAPVICLFLAYGSLLLLMQGAWIVTITASLLAILSSLRNHNSRMGKILNLLVISLAVIASLIALTDVWPR